MAAAAARADLAPRQARYLELDTERAAFTAERAEFAEEVKLNLAQYDQQQKELTDMVEKHRRDNEDLLAKRQAQYEAQVRARSRARARSGAPPDPPPPLSRGSLPRYRGSRRS